VTRKWWKKRISVLVNKVGVDWSAAVGDETMTSDDSGEAEEAADDRERVSGYSHTKPMRVQWAHSGRVSWHLTFLRLQLKQPRRDLVWPLRGMGLRRMLMVSSVPDADGVADGVAAGVAEAEDGPESGGSTRCASIVVMICRFLPPLTVA